MHIDLEDWYKYSVTFFYMYLMFLPHSKHTYGSPQPVTRITSSLFYLHQLKHFPSWLPRSFLLHKKAFQLTTFCNASHTVINGRIFMGGTGRGGFVDYLPTLLLVPENRYE
jgi:hypothetical protein